MDAVLGLILAGGSMSVAVVSFISFSLAQYMVILGLEVLRSSLQQGL